MPRLIPSLGTSAGRAAAQQRRTRTRTDTWTGKGTEKRAEKQTGKRAEKRVEKRAEKRTEQRPGKRAGDGTGFGVPLFAHPLVAPAEWAELARPGAPLHWTAFDVRRGPGSRPDPLYDEALGRVRENGVPVLGLLDCVHGTRPFGELVLDASHYLDWYRVDGFYLDRAPMLRSEAAECRRVTSTLRAMLGKELAGQAREPAPGPAGTAAPRPGSAPGSAPGPGPADGLIVLAPGAYPHPSYVEAADQLVVFNGPWARYRWSEAPQWSAAHPPSRFAHLVHGLSAGHLDTALRIARWQGAATVCMTDRTGRDPWTGLPGYWHEAVRKAV